jgi:aryl-alcohol dehydrogenase-like predicted oxidoreductase
LGWGRLTGKVRRGQPLPEVSRLHKTAEQGPPVADDLLYRIVDVLDSLSAETGKSVPRLALNWLLRKPTISTVVIGARHEQQLRENLAAASFSLTPEQVARLDEVSQAPAPYPTWHQQQFHRNPRPASYRS